MNFVILQFAFGNTESFSFLVFEEDSKLLAEALESPNEIPSIAVKKTIIHKFSSLDWTNAHIYKDGFIAALLKYREVDE